MRTAVSSIVSFTFTSTGRLSLRFPAHIRLQAFAVSQLIYSPPHIAHRRTYSVQQTYTRNMSTTSSSAAHAANSNSSAFKSSELPHLDGVEAAKRAAAYAAVDNHVKPEHEIIGIGSGK